MRALALSRFVVLTCAFFFRLSFIALDDATTARGRERRREVAGGWAAAGGCIHALFRRRREPATRDEFRGAFEKRRGMK
jgi:hypothetical protein